PHPQEGGRGRPQAARKFAGQAARPPVAARIRARGTEVLRRRDLLARGRRAGTAADRVAEAPGRPPRPAVPADRGVDPARRRAPVVHRVGAEAAAAHSGRMTPDWVRVGDVAQWIKGRGRRVDVGGAPVAVFWDGSRWIAVDDTWPHMGASLAEGRLLDG